MNPSIAIINWIKKDKENSMHILTVEKTNICSEWSIWECDLERV